MGLHFCFTLYTSTFKLHSCFTTELNVVLLTEDEINTQILPLGVDGRIIFRWIFRKWDGGAWAGLIWLRTETGGGHL
jgi:hypothetical protein